MTKQIKTDHAFGKFFAFHLNFLSFFSVFTATFVAVVFFFSKPSFAEDVSSPNLDRNHKLLKEKLIRLIGSNDAVILRDEAGKLLFQKNEQKILVPASTLKVLTSLAAIHYFGENYRFPTDFFIDDSNNLIIKGYGDPLLVSEVIRNDIIPKIKEKTAEINQLIFDDSFFAKPIVIPGRVKSLQPYDAPNGAFCVNFNTVFFKKEKGVYTSAEEQTPLLPFAKRKAQLSRLSEGRITLAHKNNEVIEYAGELFGYFLKEAGITFHGKPISRQTMLPEEKRIFRYHSRYTLSETISKLLEFSNNFTANQLFIAIGAEVFGPPGDINKGIQAVTAFARDKISSGTFQLSEGSGLSRENKVNALFMAGLLDAFYPYHHLMHKEETVFFKTGTLQDIKTKIGYISKNRKIYRFVILVNTPSKTTDPILKTILKYL